MDNAHDGYNPPKHHELEHGRTYLALAHVAAVTKVTRYDNLDFNPAPQRRQYTCRDDTQR